MYQILDYYLQIFSKPLGQLSLLEISAVAAIPFAALIGIWLVAILAGSLIEEIGVFRESLSHENKTKRLAARFMLGMAGALVILFGFAFSQ